jgi:hypothetical protein
MGIVKIPNQPINLGETSCVASQYLSTDNISLQFNRDNSGNCGEVELVCNGAFELGTQYVSNSSFVSGATGWTVVSNWTLFAGLASFTGDGNPANFSQVVGSYAANNYYIVKINIDTNETGLLITFAGSSNIIPAGTVGDITLFFDLSIVTEDVLEVAIIDTTAALTTSIFSIEVYDVCWTSESFDGITFNEGEIAVVPDSLDRTLDNIGIVAASTAYVLEFTISSYIAGTIDINLGGNVANTGINGDGVQTLFITSDAGSDLTFTFSDTFEGVISGVSVQAVNTSVLVDIFDNNDVYVTSIKSEDITIDEGNYAVSIAIADYITEEGCYQFAVTDGCGGRMFQT